jgi:uncharacterized protein with HEPN domain
MNERDEVRLRHMLEAAQEALGFAKDKTEEDLLKDRMLLLSLVKAIEIVGEAARNVSEETRSQLPGIPWSQIVGMRNQLTHGYFNWIPQRIWETVVSRLPELIGQLEAVLPPIS